MLSLDGRRGQKSAVLFAAFLSSACGMPASADAEDTFDAPLLRRHATPRLAAMPPFLRDTDLRLHLRTYYLNERRADQAVSEAWAGGGWLSYRSGWLLDTFQIGATLYGSAPLYAPADRDGTLLLAPGQDGIVVPGVAFGALRYRELALLTGYRQLVDQTYVNPHDNRMVPTTFEGVTLGGEAGPVRYLGGYLTRMKPRDADRFISIAEGAGVESADSGLALAGIEAKLWDGFSFELSNQYASDLFNTAYARADYQREVAPDWHLTLSGQYTDQRAVGDELLGGSKFESWVTWVGGARVQLRYRDLTLTSAFSVTGTGHRIETPFGQYPGYLRLIIEDFNRAGEVAWLVGLRYDASRLLRGLEGVFNIARGTSAIDPVTRRPEPDRVEYDVRVSYHAPKSGPTRGITVRTSAGLVDNEGSRTPQYEIRLIVDYELPLF